MASLNGSRIAQLFACHQAELSVHSKASANQTVDLTNLYKVVKTIMEEEIDTFSSKIIHGQTKTMLLGNNMQVMMQSLKGSDGPHLPHGLSVVNTYTKVTTRGKKVAVVVKNLMAIPITITKGIKVIQAVAVNAVPQVEVALRMLEKLNEMQCIQQTKMFAEWRRDLLFHQLDLSGLEGWSKENQAATHTLLAEYHDKFPLEPGELGCTNIAKHKIRVVPWWMRSGHT